jgi:hypothetical protein
MCIVAAGENGNNLNHSALYLNKTVMVIIIKIYDRDKFLPVTTCKRNLFKSFVLRIQILKEIVLAEFLKIFIKIDIGMNNKRMFHKI